MGLDFVKRAAPDYKKGLDRARLQLGTPHLFTKPIVEQARAYAARPLHGEVLRVGEEVGLYLHGDSILVLRGLRPVAVLTQPPPGLVEAITTTFGEASGEVQHCHQMSQIAEIAIVC